MVQIKTKSKWKSKRSGRIITLHHVDDLEVAWETNRREYWKDIKSFLKRYELVEGPKGGKG